MLVVEPAGQPARNTTKAAMNSRSATAVRWSPGTIVTVVGALVIAAASFSGSPAKASS